MTYSRSIQVGSNYNTTCIELGSDICLKEMKLIVKFKRPKGFMGVELHEDVVVKANSLEYQSECAEASIRYRLIIN